MPAPVVDFHLHCYDRPLRAPESFIAFMDRELARTYGDHLGHREQRDGRGALP
jgi:hypothetical protein